MNISDDKYRVFLNMRNFINNVLPLLLTPDELELCKKYFKDGRLSNDDFNKLVKNRL